MVTANFALEFGRWWITWQANVTISKWITKYAQRRIARQRYLSPLLVQIVRSSFVSSTDGQRNIIVNHSPRF
jgi:protoheme ferro-lyase